MDLIPFAPFAHLQQDNRTGICTRAPMNAYIICINIIQCTYMYVSGDITTLNFAFDDHDSSARILRPLSRP